MSWDYAYTPYIWPMLGSGLLAFALAIYAWYHRRVPGAYAFALQGLFIALWGIFTAFEIAATTSSNKIFFHKIEAAVGIIALGAMFYFALELTSLGKWANKRTLLLLSLVTLSLFLLMATNDWHHLIWTRLWFDQFTRVDRGPLNPLLLGWAFLMPVVAMLLFFRLLLRSRGIYRKQALALFIAALLPLTAYSLEFAGVNPIAPLDPVILVFSISCLLYALAIFRFGMLAVVPIGRETAFERMVIGVMILDAKNQIADINLAAAKALGVSQKKVIGHQVEKALAAHADLCRLLERANAVGAEVMLGPAGSTRYFQIQASLLTHPNGSYLGKLIYLQDITDQRLAQAQIIEQQRVLATLHERERMARELHDSLGQVLSYASFQVEAAAKLVQEGQINTAAAQLDRLGGVIRETHADMRETIMNLRSAPTLQQPLFKKLAQYLEGYTSNYDIQTRLNVDPKLDDSQFSLEAQLQLFRIIQEALSNARKHGRARHVSVTFSVNNGHVCLSIQDDGQGFDPQAATPGSQHFGLQFMRERSGQVGGALQIHSAPGSGAEVVVEIPLKELLDARIIG